MQTIAIDLGYGDTKVATKDKLFKFPTAVEKEKESFADFGEQKEKISYLYNGKKYRVGKSALSGALTTRGFDFLEKYSPLLAYKAIEEAGLDLSQPIYIKSGLSLVNWKDKEKFAESLKNININNKTIQCKVKLMAQGEGIYINYKGDKNGLTAIVDIGYNTLDFIVFEDGNPRPDLSFATNKGVNIVITEFQTKLQKRYDYDLTEAMAKKIFDSGYLKILGDKKDLKDIIEDSKEEYTQIMLNEIKNKRKEVLQIANAVIFSGGGAYFIDKNMKLPKNLIFSEEPYEYANVKGYYHG